MVILRQGFRRISRCPLGVVQLCLSFFLWLYQFIMRRNDQNMPEVVEHDYFEGETSFVSICDKIVWSKLNFRNTSYHFVESTNLRIFYHERWSAVKVRLLSLGRLRSKVFKYCKTWKTWRLLGRVPKRYSERCFRRGFYLERRQEQKPKTVNFILSFWQP